MKVKPFGITATFAIIILSVGLVNHVLIVPLLLGEAGRDAWMSVLLSLTVILPWSLIPLCAILKKMNKTRIDIWLKERLHPLIAGALITYFLILIMITGLETLIVTSSWTGTSYLPRTPFLAIIIILLCLCHYAASMGLRTIAYISCLLIPIVVFFGDFVMSANMPNKDYRYVLPMLEHGAIPVITASMNCLTAFSELFSLLFIQHHMSKRMSRWHMIILVLFLALLAIGPILGAISEFGPVEATKLKYPAYSQWRLVTVGKYFEHVDFLAIFQWLAGALVRISLAIYILIEFSPINRMKRKWAGYLIISVVFVIFATYWTNHMSLYQEIIKWRFKNIGLITLMVVLFIYAISFMKKRR
ncbi:endospore germination permease [Paenibacillus sp. GSMTC-2017]|nr:endospore germination permease [Paenibacillus sp. GSMTC-2017]